MRRRVAARYVTCNLRDTMATEARSASRDKVRAVPDVRTRAFSLAAHRQLLAVAKSAHADDDQAFVDAISAWDAE